MLGFLKFYNSRPKAERFGQTPTDYEKERTRKRMPGIRLYHELCGERQADVPANSDFSDNSNPSDNRDYSNNLKTSNNSEPNDNPNNNNLGDIDAITWADLEMDEIFLRLNQTESYMGEQVLYQRLHNTNSTSTELANLEQQIAFYQNNPQQRAKLAEKLQRIGKSEHDYYLPAFLRHAELWSISNGFWLHLLQILLLSFLAGVLLTEHILFTMGLITVICINLVLYIATRQRYESFLYSLGGLKKLLIFCQMLTGPEYRSGLGVSEKIVQLVTQLKGLSRQIIGWQGRKHAALTGDFLYIVQDYLFGITLLDIAMFNHIMKKIDGRQTELMELYEFAGEIDLGIAVASFRASLAYYCQPDIDERKEFTIKGLVHPLLNKAVANDFDLKRGALITGANASGKSTFMKALAINALLAQTIHTCTARRFAMPAVDVMTSMSLRDAVLTGESYYIREARRIGKMLDERELKRPALLVIDEILKGTNTGERIAASSAILEYFTKLPHYLVVATHDLELVRDMQLKYAVYYFDSCIIDEDIVFDYKIHQGCGGNANAIMLLSLLKYPREIVTNARRKAGFEV